MVCSGNAKIEYQMVPRTTGGNRRAHATGGERGRGKARVGEVHDGRVLAAFLILYPM